MTLKIKSKKEKYTRQIKSQMQSFNENNSQAYIWQKWMMLDSIISNKMGKSEAN